MLQIKNTLGGGKPEGIYVWKKYEYTAAVLLAILRRMEPHLQLFHQILT